MPARTIEGGPPEFVGKLLEAVSNGGPRWMITARMRVQNPAHMPSRSQHQLRPEPLGWGTMKLYAAQLDFRPIAREFQIPERFAEELHREAAEAQDRFADARIDARDIAFVTIDPAGSMDLDQAVHIEAAAAGGYRVRYAIADVAAFVAPCSPLEAETFRRGQTYYLPDEPTRLHPAELSEDRASLLPNVDRPAVLWTIDLDAAGSPVAATVQRALVRSVARLDYDGVHTDFQAGTMHPSIALLPQVGRLRQQSALRRHAVNLRLPAQRVEATTDGLWQLVLDPRHEVNDWNSEISLLTGMVAGQMMVDAGVGLLRTLPPGSKSDLENFVEAARALGFTVGESGGESGDSIGEFLLSVDASEPRGMAVMKEAQKLLRGAGYLWFDGEVPEESKRIHAGIGGAYAHVTAPLRRLADRFATEICLAIAAGEQVPEWVSSRSGELVKAMNRTSALNNQVANACLSLTEAVVLRPWLNQNFTAAVLHTKPSGTSDVFTADPPIIATCYGAPPVGANALVTLTEADPQARKVSFSWPAD